MVLMDSLEVKTTTTTTAAAVFQQVASFTGIIGSSKSHAKTKQVGSNVTLV